MTYQQLAQRVFNRTKFTQVMKYSVINMYYPYLTKKDLFVFGESTIEIY